MRHLTPLFATALLALSACGDATPDAEPNAAAAPMLSLASGSQLHLVLATQVTIDEYDVHDEGTGDTKRVSDVVRSEWWLAPDGTFVERSTDEGLALETVVRGSDAWRRAGSVAAEIPAQELPSVLASAEDLVCVLGWAEAWPSLATQVQSDGDAAAIITGDGRPVRHVFADAETGNSMRLETFAVADAGAPGNTNALASLVTEGSLPVAGSEGGAVPSAVVRTVPGPGRLTETRITIESATVVSGDKALALSKPERSQSEYGPPTRRERRQANVVISEHSGPLTDVPRLAAYVRRGLADAKAQPRGALGLEFDRFPEETRAPALRMVVPVTLSQARDAGDLPKGLMTRTEEARDVVAVPYRGALPASEADLEPALEAVRALGLEPDGPVRVLLTKDLSDPAAGALDFELEVPVRERD